MEKYKRFIKKVEKSPFFDKRKLRLLRSLRSLAMTDGTVIARRREGPTKQSPNAVAKIVKSSKGFSLRYTYEGFIKIYRFESKILSTFLHKLRRISSRNELTHRILKGIVKHQREYLSTGNPEDLVSLSQVKLTEWINKTQYASRSTQYGICNSWVSRLVNRLLVITPFGEEKPLKWFFQNQKDINKRLIKKLFDKENKDIESGKLDKPLTDNQIRTKLEDEFGNKLSRHSIGHCRKDMGIPPAKRRLSGYKYPPLSANFSLVYPLTMEAVLKYAPEKSGVYEFSIKRTTVFYIGSTKNIRKRLREHLGKNSKNGYIREFLKRIDCSFRYIQFLKNWKEEERRLYSLFVGTYGIPPRCNRVRPGGE